MKLGLIITAILFAVSAFAGLVPDTSQPALGNAYRDTSTGLIWGALATRDGSVFPMEHDRALDYCAKRGARLPKKEELQSFINGLGHSGADGVFINTFTNEFSGIIAVWTQTEGPQSADIIPTFYGYRAKNAKMDLFYQNTLLDAHCVVDTLEN